MLGVWLSGEVLQRKKSEVFRIGDPFLDEMQKPMNDGNSKTVAVGALVRIAREQIIPDALESVLDRIEGAVVIETKWVL